MKLSVSDVLVTTLGCVLVGGCSIFSPKPVALSSSAIGNAPSAGDGETLASTSEVTNAGRALLDAGQPGLAVDTFRKALAKGEAEAPALNGLGVAYARIGRQDLAIWYFKQAMVVDPGDTRYAKNLERVMAEAGSTSAGTNLLAEAASPSPAGGDDEAGEPVPANSSIRRAARPEVKIVPALPQPSGRARLVRITTASYPARVVFAGRSNPASRSRMVYVAPNRTRITGAPYPARIDLADRKNPVDKSRWVDVAPNNTRIVHVGSSSTRKPAPAVRMAAIDLP